MDLRIEAVAREPRAGVQAAVVPRFEVAVDQGERGLKGLQLIAAGRTSQPVIPTPNYSGQTKTRAWHMPTMTENQLRAFFAVLVRYRDVVVVGNIDFRTTNGHGEKPTRTLMIPIASHPDHTARRLELMNIIHERFGLPRLPHGYDTHGLVIALNSCTANLIDVDRLVAAMRTLGVDDGLVRDVFRAQGPQPPDVDPADPYLTGPDVDRFVEDPLCVSA